MSGSSFALIRIVYLSISILLLLLLIDSVASYGKSFGIGLLLTFNEFYDWLFDAFFYDVLSTTQRVFVGFSLAIVFGLLIGLFTARINYIGGAVSPFLNFLRSITPVALSPFFLMAFGIGELSKISMIAWSAFFPIWLNTHYGLLRLKPEFVHSAKLLGLVGQKGIMHFWLPAALRASFPGVRLGMGIAYILVFVSEGLGASSGVGFRLTVAYDTINIPLMCNCLLVLGFLGLISDRLIIFFASIYAPWLTIKDD